jgi:hypothetical protein
MSSSDDILNAAPFPEMTWSDYDCWEGSVCLPAWGGFLSCRGAYGASESQSPSDGMVTLNVTPHDPGISRIPSEAQAKAFQFQLDHGEEVVASVLRSLHPYYNALRPRWVAAFGEEISADIMPLASDPGDFRRLIGLHQIHVHSWKRDNMSYIGLEFGCSWDEEHGFGVMLHGSRIVDIGSADASFAWRPKEAETP